MTGKMSGDEFLAYKCVMGVIFWFLFVIVLGTIIIFTGAYLLEKSRGFAIGRGIAQFIAMLPLAVPGLVMALGILWTWVAAPIPIYGTILVIIVAFIGKFMPAGYRVISASMLQIHDDLEHAAMVSGATRAQMVTSSPMGRLDSSVNCPRGR